MFKKPNAKKMQAECDAFNASNPVGSRVMVQLDNRKEPFDTVTTSKAQILSGHSAVIWLEKVSGCYLLDRVTPVKRVRAGSAGHAFKAEAPQSSPALYPLTSSDWKTNDEPASTPAPAYSSGGGGSFGGGGASSSWSDSSSASSASSSSDSSSSSSSD